MALRYWTRTEISSRAWLKLRSEAAEQFAHGAPLTVQVKVELTDPGPAGQDRIHLGIGGRPDQPGLASNGTAQGT